MSALTFSRIIEASFFLKIILKMRKSIETMVAAHLPFFGVELHICPTLIKKCNETKGECFAPLEVPYSIGAVRWSAKHFFCFLFAQLIIWYLPDRLNQHGNQ